MLIDQMKHMSNERQNFIRGIIDMSYEYITDVENYTDNCLERNDIINRSFDTDISDEIELLYNNERLIKHYNKNKSWFEIESYYLDSNAILWFNQNNINYVAIKHIEDTQCYTIFVRYENNRKLFELVYEDNISVSLSCSMSKDFLNDVDHILLTSNWASIKNPITEFFYARFYNHLTEVGEQYID